MALLDKEFDYYLAHQDELVKEYSGKYLVIKGEEVVGAFDTQNEAYFDSEKKFGLGNFLIQFCSEGNSAYTNIFYTQRVKFA